MRVMKLQFACALLLAAPPASSADSVQWCGGTQVHPVDADFARAIERSGGVTVDMRDAQGVAYAGWDAELNRLYRQAMQRFAGDARADALRTAQRAWLAWDRAESRSDHFQHADVGTSGPLAVADLAIARRRARACALQAMRAGLEDSVD